MIAISNYLISTPSHAADSVYSSSITALLAVAVIRAAASIEVLLAAVAVAVAAAAALWLNVTVVVSQDWYHF
jgi:hypothetical protein